MKKQIVPCEITGREVSLEWSLHRILSSDSKVSVTLQNSIIHSGSERVEPPHDRKILMWTKSYSLKKKKINNHVCANIFKLAFIFSEIKNNFFCQIKMIYNYYMSFLLLFNSQIQVARQKKVQKNISYHSLIVTSAIPSPMSDNLNGRISPFIPLNKQTNKQIIST